MNVRFHLFLPYCLIALPSCIFAHELEDGFVERAVEIVVRDRQLQLNYFIGLNEATMKQLLEQWGTGSTANVDSDESGELVTFFEKKISNKLQELIDFKVNDETLQLTSVGVEICPKHHFDFVIKLEHSLPADQTVEIELSDHKLDHWKSAARYSLKGLGATIVANTNVAPIIVRSKRVEFEKLTDVERLKKCKIVATVITPPDKSKNEMAVK